MATNLKQDWFKAILSGQLSTLSRLLYATPNPKAGIERLSWTLDESVEVNFEINQDIQSKLGLDSKMLLWSLPLSIFSFLQQGRSKAMLDISKIILSTCPTNLIDTDIGNANSVFHLVAAIGDMELVRMIIDKKPNPMLLNKQGEKPSDISAALVKNMIKNYENEYIRATAVKPRPPKLISTDSNSFALLSNVNRNKEEQAETILKELGIDENDHEAETIKKELISRATSGNFNAKPVKIGLRSNCSANFQTESDIKVFIGSSSTKQEKKPNAAKIVNEEESNSESPLIAVPPPFTTDDEGRVKEVKLYSKELNNSKRDLVSVFPLDIHKSRYLSNVPDKVDGKTEGDINSTHDPIVEEVSFDGEKTRYEHKLKQPVMILVDEDQNAMKAVNFKNSWKGELEKTRKFYSDATTLSVSSNLGRPAISPKSFIPPSSKKAQGSSLNLGKMLLKLKSLRDVVLNTSVVPESSYLYCVVTSSNGMKPVKTQLISFSYENMNTTIPIGTEFGIDMWNSSISVKVELHVRYEYVQKEKKQSLFRSGTMRNMFSRAGMSRPASRMTLARDTHEQKIAQLVIPVQKLMVNEKKESKQLWDAVDYNTIPVKAYGNTGSIKRSPSRASFDYIKSKIMNIKDHKESEEGFTCELVESGYLTFETYFVDNIKDDFELKSVPDKFEEASDWCARREWLKTCWFSGYLSQQGGDVKYWRRRFFKIVGSKMEAHHEFSHEYRTTIDLSQLVYLDLLPATTDGESYPTHNSFRLNFKHGESIDFYAETRDDYKNWIEVIKKVAADMPDASVWIGESSIKGNSSSTDSLKSKRRSPKKISMDDVWTSVNTNNEADDTYKSYEKRYKTPAVKKGVTLMKKPTTFDDDITEEEDNVVYEGREYGKLSTSSSFVGIFGTLKSRSIPELFLSILMIWLLGSIALVYGQCDVEYPCRIFNITAAKRYGPAINFDGVISLNGEISGSASFNNNPFIFLLPPFLNITVGNSGNNLATVTMITTSFGLPQTITCDYYGIGVSQPWTAEEMAAANAYAFQQCVDSSGLLIPSLFVGSSLTITQIVVSVQDGGSTDPGDIAAVYVTLYETSPNCVHIPYSSMLAVGTNSLNYVYVAQFQLNRTTISCVGSPKTTTTTSIATTTPLSIYQSDYSYTSTSFTTFFELTTSHPVITSSTTGVSALPVTTTIATSTQSNVPSSPEVQQQLPFVILLSAGVAGGIFLILIIVILVLCRKRCCVDPNSDPEKIAKKGIFESNGTFFSSNETMDAANVKRSLDSLDKMGDFDSVYGYYDEQEDFKKSSKQNLYPHNIGSSHDIGPTLNTGRTTDFEQTLMNTKAVIALPGFLKMDYHADLRPDKTIAEGGGGIIYEAELMDDRLKEKHRVKKVAVKVVKNPGNWTHEDFLTNFQQEVSIMWSLSFHENIIKLVGYTEEPMAIIMKYYSLTMGELVKNPEFHELLNSETILRFSYHVIHAMSEMHALGIVHRDLKTINLLIDVPAGTATEPRMWKVVVCDFGLAKPLNEAEVVAAKTADVQGISIRYAAPEVFQRVHIKKNNSLSIPEDKSVNSGEREKKGDVYAFAIIQWELIEKSMVWPGMKNDEIEWQVRNGNRPTISERVIKLCQEDSTIDLLVNLMILSWCQDYKCRPNFSDLRARLDPYYTEIPQPEFDAAGNRQSWRLSNHEMSSHNRMLTSGTRTSLNKSKSSRPVSVATSQNVTANPAHNRSSTINTKPRTRNPTVEDQKKRVRYSTFGNSE